FSSRAAKQGSEAMSYDYRGERNTFLREAARLYSDCIISQQTIRQLEEQMEVSLGLLRIAETGLQTGQSDSTTFLQARINAEKDRIAVSSAQLDWIKLKDQLKVILNLEIEADLQLEESLD